MEWFFAVYSQLQQNAAHELPLQTPRERRIRGLHLDRGTYLCTPVQSREFLAG